jgi:hypothetical protein
MILIYLHWDVSKREWLEFVRRKIVAVMSLRMLLCTSQT